MQYLGSKNKISSEILSVIKPYLQDKIWVEPFVGGGNMIDKLEGYRIGADNNRYLIELLKSVQEGWVPPTNISREEYYKIKKSIDKYNPALVAFVGFLCSFGGKWFGGYAFNKKGDNYAERGSRSLVKQSKRIQDVKFLCCDYFNLNIPDNALIYCDPPYDCKTKYKDGFDHLKFWDWCREISKKYPVFISEYSAPQDFICVKEIETKTILDKNSDYKRIEKLFIYKP